MVEPAFGLLKQQIDEMLADGQAQPARRTGAECFEFDPKSSDMPSCHTVVNPCWVGCFAIPC